MMKPQDIIDRINGDFRIGNVSLPLFVEVKVMPDDYGRDAICHRFYDDGKEKLIEFLFDQSLSRKIYEFSQMRMFNEIGVNGFDDAVVGYRISVFRCRKGENESNITPELIEFLVQVLSPKRYVEFGWDSDQMFGEGGLECS